MPDSTNWYADIRQIVQDAVLPIKDQLDKVYDSLNKEFYRKDALDPQLAAIRAELKEVKDHVMGTAQRYLLYIGTSLGAILSLITILHYFHMF